MSIPHPHLIYQQTPVYKRRRVAEMPVKERPLYRLHHHGSDALATTELLALLLGTADSPGLAEELLGQFQTIHQLARASKNQLMKIRGIGEAQAAKLLATLELCKRLQLPANGEHPKISCPEDAAQLMMPRLQHLKQEELHVLLLNTRNSVLDIQAIYRGSLNTSVIRIGEIFRPAIEATAAAIIVAHNHPSGQASPSPEDIRVTRQIVQAGQLLNIECLDHIIIGNTFVSLKEQGYGFD